jgi:regulatory protein
MAEPDIEVGGRNGDGRRDGAALRDTALRLLGRREYSAFEMRRKLVARGYGTPAVDGMLASLREEQLQSDERFAESFVRMRIERGQGPIRVRAELRERGVGDPVIDAVTTHTSEFWIVCARRVLSRRFGRGSSAISPISKMTRDEWHRRARFLAQRGFPSDVIARALRNDV